MATRRKKFASSRVRRPQPDLEGALVTQLGEAGILGHEREYRFHPTRRWRFDFAWPTKMVACEVDGAIFIGGRHSRGAGIVKDAEKFNTAVAMGWVVLRIVAPHIQNGEAVEWIRKTLALRRKRSVSSKRLAAAA